MEVVLEQASATLDDVIEAVRTAALELRPSMLDDLGLIPALDWLARRHLSESDLHVEFTHTAVATRPDLMSKLRYIESPRRASQMSFVTPRPIEQS